MLESVFFFAWRTVRKRIAAVATGVLVLMPALVSAQVHQRSDRPSGIELFRTQAQPMLVVGAPGEVFRIEPGTLECTPEEPSACEVRGGAAYVYGRARQQHALDRQAFELLPMQRIVASLPGSRDEFGYKILLGDMDGDNSGDLVVGNRGGGRGVNGMPSRPGLVHVFDLGGSGFRERQVLRPESSVSLGTPGHQGHALALHDINQDGFADLIAGSPGHPSSNSGVGSGAFFAYQNQGENLSHLAGVFLPNPLILNGTDLIAGTNWNQKSFGYSLAAGDFDGDGMGDLAVGAPEASHGNQMNAGAVFEFHGGGEGVVAIRLHDQGGLSPLEADDRFGSSLAAADFDDDGFDDLAVAAPGETLDPRFARTGLILIFSGSPDGLALNEAIDPRQWAEMLEDDTGFGFSMATGDFDDDGAIELAVGAPGASTSSSRPRALSAGDPARREIGRVSRHLNSTHCGPQIGENGRVRPGIPATHCGKNVAGNSSERKSIKKLAVTGAVYVFQRTDQGWQLEQVLGRGRERQEAQQHGFSLGAADLDGDGITDLVVGAPNRALQGPVGQRAGAVFIYLGSEAGLQLSHSVSQGDLDAEEEGDRFGASVGVWAASPKLIRFK